MVQQRKIKRKRNKNKAGFGTANVVLIIMFSGFSFGFTKDIAIKVNDIVKAQRVYEQTVELNNQKNADKQLLLEKKERLSNTDYILEYIRGSMWLTKEDETIFVLQKAE